VSSELHQQVGKHDAEIDALKGDMAEVKSDVKQILAFVNQAQGSWKTLLAIGGFAAAVGGLVSWAVHTFLGK
jgi:hypothetical protein